MSRRPDPDPIDLLRRLDPVPSRRPSPMQEARLRAGIEEVIAMDQVGNRGSRRSLWQVPALRAAASVALASGIVVAALILRPDGSPGAGGSSGSTLPPASVAAVVPSPTSLAPTVEPTSAPDSGPISPGGGMALCVETYDLATLEHREFAFDGTVTAIDGDEATFLVNTLFKGSGGSSITLTATGMTDGAITSAGGPNLSVGGRYLVAGDDHFAWACGFTQPYDSSVAEAWAGTLK